MAEPGVAREASEHASPGNARRLVFGTGVIGISSFANVASAALLTGVALQHTSLAAIGQWSVLVALASLFGVIDLGLTGTVARFTAEYYSSHVRGRVWQVWSLAGTALLGITALATAGVMIFPTIFESVIHASTADMIIWLPVLVGCQMSTDQVRSALLGLSRTTTAGALELAGTLTGFLVALVLLRNGVGIESLGFGIATRTVLIVLPGLTFAFLAMRGETYQRPTRSTGRKLLSYSTPLLAVAMTGVIFLNGGRICLSLVSGPDSVGIFEAANRVALVLVAAASPVLVVALPYLTTVRHDSSAMRRGVRMIEGALAVILGVLGGGLVITGAFALAIWLPEVSTTGSWTLVALIVSYVLLISTGSATVALRARGRQWIEAVSLASGAAVLLASVLVMSSALASIGAAAGVAIGGLVYLLVLYFMMRMNGEGTFRPNLSGAAFSVLLVAVATALTVAGDLLGGADDSGVFLRTLVELGAFGAIAALVVIIRRSSRISILELLSLLRRRNKGSTSGERLV